MSTTNLIVYFWYRFELRLKLFLGSISTKNPCPFTKIEDSSIDESHFGLSCSQIEERNDKAIDLSNAVLKVTLEPHSLTPILKKINIKTTIDEYCFRINLKTTAFSECSFENI